MLQKMEASWKLRGAKAIYAQMWSSQSWWMLGPRWPPRMGILRIPLGVTLVFGASLREASLLRDFHQARSWNLLNGKFMFLP